MYPNHSTKTRKHAFPSVLRSIILGLVDGDVSTLDPEIQKAALHVINNVVCGPQSRGADRTPPPPPAAGTAGKKRAGAKGSEDLLTKMWSLIRANHGIMVSVKSFLSSENQTQFFGLLADGHCCATVVQLRSAGKLRSQLLFSVLRLC